MPEKQIILKINQSYKVAYLSDKSFIYIKRLNLDQGGQYTIMRRMDKGTPETDMILENNYVTFDAALSRAWFYFNMLNK